MRKKDLENVRKAILKYSNGDKLQLFTTRNIVGDEMETVYMEKGVMLDYCKDWHYFELFGASKEELKTLQDICIVEAKLC